MITSTDIFQEVVNAIELVDKTGTDYEKSMIKLLSIAIKLLHNIRTNQTEIMKSQGITLKKPEKANEENQQDNKV